MTPDRLLLNRSDLRVLFLLPRTTRRTDKEKVSSEMEVSLVKGITLRKIPIFLLLIIIPLRYGFIALEVVQSDLRSLQLFINFTCKFKYKETETQF